MIANVRDEAVRVMTEDYPSVLAQVCLAYGANAPPPRSVSRSRRRHKSYPLAVVRLPSGRGDDNLSTDSTLHGDLLIWVVVWVMCSDDETRERQLEMHGEAITRAFHGHRLGGAMRFSFALCDWSSADKQDGETIQAIGVQLSVRVAEDLDE